MFLLTKMSRNFCACRIADILVGLSDFMFSSRPSFIADRAYKSSSVIVHNDFPELHAVLGAVRNIFDERRLSIILPIEIKGRFKSKAAGLFWDKLQNHPREKIQKE